MESILFHVVAVLLLVQFMVISTTKVVTNITTDQYALLDFKAHITSDILAQNWSTSTPICQWVGVSCSARHGRVTALNLSNMTLQGTISPHLGNLSFLISLNLSINNFDGSLPNELGKLPQLKWIDVSHNSFSGIIPHSMFNMSKLEIMNLSYNLIEGSIPIEEGQLPSLKVLYAHNNRLSGSLPDDMCKCFPKVEKLALSNNTFVGTIPRSIGNLTKLKKLYLSVNNLRGDIPQELGNLVELEILSMANMGLGGSIPFFIFNMSSLKMIYLYGNRFVGSLPVDICHHLPLLKELHLGENKLIGRIPKSIGNCTLLERLWLDYNYLGGTIPLEVGHLQNLETLDVGSNNLTSNIPSSIFNISTLKILSLWNNQLTGNLPSSIGDTLPNLEEIYLWNNQLSGPIPSSISNASKLVTLSLQKNSFTGNIFPSLGNLRSLQWLSLGENDFAGESSSQELTYLSSLTNCLNLRFLDLWDNPLNGILPSSIGNFSSALENVYLEYCGLKGGIPMEIGNWSNVILINLSANELTGLVPIAIGRLHNLQGLFLYDNKLQGQIPTELCQLHRSDTLSLGDNMLNGSIPACIGNLSSLRYLDLSSNRLSSAIPTTLWSLTYILKVYLTSNSLTGSLSSEIGSLKVIIEVDLSGNKLSGNIPSSIGELKDLTFLSLADNAFDGQIPKSFDGLISLERLDLSNNEVSGVIPKSLEKLSYLRYFNVSFNRLQGEIPNGGPFVNFSAQLFLSNEGLCGSPRLQVPPCKTTKARRSNPTFVLLLKYVLPAIASTILLVSLIIIHTRARKRKANLPVQDILTPLSMLKRISYQELQRATNGFSEGNLLGTGSFGSVYRGTLSDSDKTQIAVKVFDLQLEGAFTNFEVECEVLRCIRHRNLVKIISSCNNNTDFKALVLKLMPNGSLERWLYSHNYFLDVFQRLNIMEDVAMALEYLHQGLSTPIVHCDLKPGNILLDEDMVAHVSDFGIAKLLGEGEAMRRTMTLATIGYMAPEHGLAGIVSTKCDVYAFGILVLETFTRKKPTDAMFVGEMNLKSWVKESLTYALSEVVDDNLLNKEERHLDDKMNCISSIMQLALSCTEDSPVDRINMSDALVALKKIKKKLLKDIESECKTRCEFPFLLFLDVKLSVTITRHDH
ncbi:probable LRR receptor-like serine/threonine-protein kinase At3g47570 [Tripterygium wilfordii]|uniref:probable LRR receptor-like serine/threonine-protein kinase At3g47570 n=1 Tax=Tripterygium wilfordii TaxID=458696 RepID=UPI0018F7E8A2|nr:probable LRR receptor-like serine/threonine-protein kinase At3g47570 [Tripterygium wilfordii]